jgi:hypothetical protein
MDFTRRKISVANSTLVMEGKIDDEWHVCYSQFTPDGGPFIELTI